MLCISVVPSVSSLCVPLFSHPCRELLEAVASERFISEDVGISGDDTSTGSPGAPETPRRGLMWKLLWEREAGIERGACRKCASTFMHMTDDCQVRLYDVGADEHACFGSDPLWGGRARGSVPSLRQRNCLYKTIHFSLKL